MRKIKLTVAGMLLTTTALSQTCNCKVTSDEVADCSIIEVIKVTENLIEWINYDDSVLPSDMTDTYLENLQEILTLLNKRENE